MGKKLTPREKDERLVHRVLQRIKTIELDYGVFLTKRACSRYVLQHNAESKLEREIQEREKELSALKNKKKVV